MTLRHFLCVLAFICTHFVSRTRADETVELTAMQTEGGPHGSQPISQLLRLSPKVLATLARYAEIQGRSPFATRIEAVMHFQEKSYSKAEEELLSLVSLQDCEAQDCWLYGRVLARLGRPADAIDYCDRSLRIDPSFHPSHLTKLAIMIELVGAKKALEDFSSAPVGHGEESYEAYLKGVAQLKLGNFDEADQNFTKSLVEYANHFHVPVSQIYLLKAVIADKVGNASSAKAFASRAIENELEGDETPYLIGWKTCREQSDHLEAHEFARKGLTSNKSSEKIQIAYFISLVDLNQHKQALAFAERALQTYSGNRRLSEGAAKVRLAIAESRTVR